MILRTRRVELRRRARMRLLHWQVGESVLTKYEIYEYGSVHLRSLRSF